MIPRRARLTLLACAAVSAGCVAAQPASHVATPSKASGLAASISPVSGRAEEPHAVAARDGSLLLAWGSVAEDGAADVLFARWGSDPVRVNPAPRTAVAGRQVGPRIALVPPGRVLVSWVDRGVDPAGDILVAASDDGGATFGAPVRVNDDAGSAGQEYQDIAVLADGCVLVTWLDERAAPQGFENQKQVHYAVSKDGGRSFERSRALTSSRDGVCPCCRPGLMATADGSVHLAYRDRVGDELFFRVASWRVGDPGFGAPVTLSAPGWKFPACPTDAPAIAAGSPGFLRVAWMDATAGEPCLWQAFSADGGQSFCVPVRFDGGGAQPARASLAWDARWGCAVAWETGDGRVLCQLVDGSAPPAPLVMDFPDNASAHSPQIVAGPGGFDLIWVETRWVEPPGGGAPRPDGRLRRARLKAEGGVLRMTP